MASLGYRKAIEELVRGREFAYQLRHVINGTHEDENDHDGSLLAEKLLKEIHLSFSNSLFILKNNTSAANSDQSSSHHDEVCDDVQLKSEEDSQSQESNCKRSSAVKERRGCYKRRRTSESWERESETPIEDGHQWRKYGQKAILKSKYPRNYYRCTHKYDQGCRATKQVQRIQENPPLHKTTYYGNHTCRRCQSPEIIVDDSVSPISDSSIFVSFDNSIPTPAKEHCPFLSSFPSPSSSVKRECKEEEKEEVPPSNDFLISSSELTFHEYDSPPTFDSDYMGVIPDVLYGSDDLDDVFKPLLEGLR